MNMDNYRSDAMLMEVLQNRKTITGFLDSIFGFLRRNTDFYHTKEDESDPIGFPKGIRDHLLYGAMQRYDPDCWLQAQVASNGFDNAENCDVSTAPPAIEEITIKSEDITESETNSSPKMLVPATFSCSDYKNGAVFNTHCWSQSQTDLEVHVKLPFDLKTAKELSVEIKSQYIKIASRGKSEQVILEGNLSRRIKHNEAVWTIDKGRLLICCDKAKERWWERLFGGDPEIDVTKIDCERYIDELPEDSQVAIEKLRVQQLVLDHEEMPSPEQSKTMERLKIAWNAEGSPFKGQPFDPSIVKMS